jgi:hypothetical protein
MSERVPLIQIPRELRRLKPVEPVPSYRTTYNAAADGRIPAEQGDNGRWSVARADLPLIAETICHAAISRTTGLPSPARPSTPSRGACRHHGGAAKARLASARVGSGAPSQRR